MATVNAVGGGNWDHLRIGDPVIPRTNPKEWIDSNKWPSVPLVPTPNFDGIKEAAENEKLRKQVAALKEKLKALEAQVEDLESQVAVKHEGKAVEGLTELIEKLS